MLLQQPGTVTRPDSVVGTSRRLGKSQTLCNNINVHHLSITFPVGHFYILTCSPQRHVGTYALSFGTSQAVRRTNDILSASRQESDAYCNVAHGDMNLHLNWNSHLSRELQVGGIL